MIDSNCCQQPVVISLRTASTGAQKSMNANTTVSAEISGKRKDMHHLEKKPKQEDANLLVVKLGFLFKIYKVKSEKASP